MKKEEKRIDRAISDSKTKCKKCGHTMLMMPNKDKCICNWCNNTVQNQSLSRFRYMFYKTQRGM